MLGIVLLIKILLFFLVDMRAAIFMGILMLLIYLLTA